MKLRALSALVLFSPMCVAAQTTATPEVQTVVQRVSWQQHQLYLSTRRTAVALCVANRKSCSAGTAGPDELLELNPQTTSRISYAWLRKALDQMATQTATQRAETANTLLERLASENMPQQPPRDARKEADAVLQQVEFAQSKPSLWERASNWIERWWAQHVRLSEVSSSTVSWVRLLLEIILFAIPLLALGLWLMRQLREDRLVPEHTQAKRDSIAPSISWHKEAQACAARGEWREAIHALYWQSITAFEERRIWAITRNRTPREYLALLQPGSDQRRLLREQTLLLESIWYGLRDATEADYQRANALAEELARA